MSVDYDVIVVGAGLAGTEASVMAARLGAKVLLLTSNLDTIGHMSCNPAIGGIAKGTVVREIDALGGIMGRATDRATIQFRMLNRSKGPAVWAPRAQCDRTLYRRAVRSLLEGFSGLELTQGMVTRLLTDGARVSGVGTADGRSFRARAVVLTAGTFLRGRIHLGTDTQIPAGRAGDQPAVDIAQHIETLGLTVSRFKTGTPPRVDGRSVDWSRVERQDGDGTAYRFSFYDHVELPRQLPCWITWAGEAVKDIIRAHLQESALYGGVVRGRRVRVVWPGTTAVRGARGRRRGFGGGDVACCGVRAAALAPGGVAEPYRLFTSRSEFRLLLRQDNALRRLAPLAERLGLLSAAEQRVAARRFEDEEALLRVARATTITPSAAAAVLAGTGTSLGEPERIASVARRPGVSLRALLEAAGVTVTAEDAAVMSAGIELKYDGYLAREREAAARLAELASFALPADLPYVEFKSLATEARQKPERTPPTSLAQATRIPGVSPSDLHNLVVEAARWHRRVA